MWKFIAVVVALSIAGVLAVLQVSRANLTSDSVHLSEADDNDNALASSSSQPDLRNRVIEVDAVDSDRTSTDIHANNQWWQSADAHTEFLAAFRAAIPDVRAWDVDTSTPGMRSTMNLNREAALEAAHKFLPVEGEFAEENGFPYQGKTFLLTLKSAISRGTQGRNLSFERFESLPDETRAAFEGEPWTKPAASFLPDWGEPNAHHFDMELESLRRIQWKYIVERARLEADMRLLGHALSRARHSTVGKDAARPPTSAESKFTPAGYMVLWDELEALPLLFQLEIEAEAKRLGH